MGRKTDNRKFYSLCSNGECKMRMACERANRQPVEGQRFHRFVPDQYGGCEWFDVRGKLRDEGSVFRPGVGKRHNSHAQPAGILNPSGGNSHQGNHARAKRIPPEKLMVGRFVRDGVDVSGTTQGLANPPSAPVSTANTYSKRNKKGLPRGYRHS